MTEVLEAIWGDSKTSYQRRNCRGILWGRICVDTNFKATLQLSAVRFYMQRQGIPDYSSKARFQSGSFILKTRTFINTNNMCPVESFVPILASACQINSDIRCFVENATTEGMAELCAAVLAFKNPTKTALRKVKDRLRDFILDNSARFFNGNLHTTMPYFNIAILFDGLFSISNSLASLLGLTIFQSCVCSQCGFQGLSRANHFVCDVGGWLDLFPEYMKIVSIETIVESISQRVEEASCTFCGMTNSIKSDYFDPKKFVIFAARIGMERVF